MKRRDFMRLGLAAATALPAVPVVAEERARLVGTLVALPADDRLGAVRQRIAQLKSEMTQRGWIEGQNIRYAIHSTFGGPEARAKAVADMIALRPDVITTSSSGETAAILAVTRSIPIVFATAADPIGSGFVETLARPGGNVTGFTNSHASIGTKWVQFLKEMDPRVRRIGVLLNPKALPQDGRYFTDPVAQAAPSFEITATMAAVTDPAQIDSAIARYAGDGTGGLIVLPDPFTVAHRELIVASAERHRVPAIYPLRYFSEVGGLISYGAEIDIRVGEYVNLILRGAKPADLPVQSPRKYELLINRKAADALGLTIPLTLVARADEITE
jgi:putative ABC transport system substrate-binding protein